MDAQQQLFSLMAAAEEHQKAAQTAIEGLAAERAAVAEERAALTQAVAGLAGAVADVRTATAAAALPSARPQVEPSRNRSKNPWTVLRRLPRRHLMKL